MAEWKLLKKHVAKSTMLRCMEPQALFHDLRDKKSSRGKAGHFFNILLLQLIVECISVDTSECERAFALLNRLQGFTRNRMGYRLLSMLMTLCSLGKHWKGKPHTIPVAEIREIWEAASKKGRYTNKAIWAACAKELEEYQAMAAAQSSQHK